MVVECCNLSPHSCVYDSEDIKVLCRWLVDPVDQEVVMTKRLYRSSTDVVLGGVCGGLGDYVGIDPVLIRLLFVFLAVVNGFGVMLYLILWIILPEKERVGESREDVVRGNIESLRDKAELLGDEIRSSVAGAHASLPVDGTDQAEIYSRRMSAAGAILAGIGILILLRNLELFWWFDLRMMWPLLIAGLGVYLLVKALREGH